MWGIGLGVVSIGSAQVWFGAGVPGCVSGVKDLKCLQLTVHFSMYSDDNRHGRLSTGIPRLKENIPLGPYRRPMPRVLGGS